MFSLKRKYRFFGLISILFLCIGLTYKYFQTDTFYMIKLGDFIYHNGIDFLDHYCWVTRLPYTYPHWLYDLFVYFVYSRFNYYGIYVSTIITFIFLIFAIYYVNLKLNKNEFFSIIVSIICIFRLSMFAVARAQLISLICFVLEFYFIYRIIETGKKRYSVGIFLLCILVANVHATVWPFFFILFLPFFAEHIISLVGKKYFHLSSFFKLKIEEIPHIKMLFFTFLISLFLGIFSPSKICYTYIFKVIMGNSQKLLSEHLPLTVIEHPFFLVSILILLIVLIFTDTKIYLRELLMIGGITFMCLTSVRHLSFFYSIVVIIIGVICVRCLNDKGDVTFDTLGRMLLGKKIIYCILLLLIGIFSYFQFFTHSKEEFILKKDYPVGAVQYIKNNLDYQNLKIYNGYNYGSYLLFNDIPVFIDARCDLYLKEFNGMNYSIFDKMENMPRNYEKEFKKMGVTHVLVSKEENLFLILRKDIHYKILYQDKYFILFEKIY